METGKGTQVKNLDELNIESKEALMKLLEVEEEQEEVAQAESLSVAERMMRRAKSNTFTLAFVDEKNDDENIGDRRIEVSAPFPFNDRQDVL